MNAIKGLSAEKIMERISFSAGGGTDARCCGNCAKFFNEDIYGLGECMFGITSDCSSVCGKWEIYNSNRRRNEYDEYANTEPYE